MLREKVAGWKDKATEELFRTKVEGWGWNMRKGTVFPELGGEKERHHEEMKTYWVGEVKSNHFELLRKVKNSVVCSNLGDTGNWRPLKNVWTNFLLLTQVQWWVAGEETGAVCGINEEGKPPPSPQVLTWGRIWDEKPQLNIIIFFSLPSFISPSFLYLLPSTWPQYSQLKGISLITCIYWV